MPILYSKAYNSSCKKNSGMTSKVYSENSVKSNDAVQLSLILTNKNVIR